MSAETSGRPREVDAALLQRRLDLLLANLTDYAVIMIDRDRRIVSWNPGAEQILSYTADDMLGQSADMFFTPEDRDDRVPEREQAEATRAGRAEDERWHLAKGGRRFFGSGILTAIRDERDTLLGYVKIMRDFTERQRAAEALARSEERYRLLIESVKDYAIFMLDANGRVTNWTSAAERLFGYTADAVVGEHFSVFFTADARQRGIPQHEVETALAKGRFEDQGWRVRRDGSRFWGEENATAVYDKTGKPVGISKVVRDATERMHAESERERLLRQATEANRLRDEFLGTVSHELRTPLNSVLGWARILRTNSLDDAGRERALEIIERNARSQVRLIEDMLDVSRIIAGKLRLQVEPVALPTIVMAALDAVRPAADAKQIHVVTHLAPDAEVVAGDPERLQQVIWNLLTNAIKFSRPGGRVDIDTTRLETEVQILVKDTGVGITPEFLPFVFDRFRQEDSSAARLEPGLGLGLAIVRHIVELHGGTVHAESAGVGTGATFRIRLPVTPAIATAPDESPGTVSPAPIPPLSTSPALDGIRIVQIDDDRDTREMIATALTRQGAKVSVAATAADGAEAVARARPHVVLVDIGLPAEDGFSFLRRLRARSRKLRHRPPTVAVTAYARETDRERALAAGFDDYLAKPIDIDELVALIQRLARRPDQS